MSFYSILASTLTVVSFMTFVSIAWWAWSRARTAAFARAAHEPFALPDENVAAEAAGERQ